MNIIELKNVTKKYKDFSLKNVNFKLTSGKIYGFVGENGSGKSTTMKIMNGLIHPNEGNCLINGKPITEFNSEEKEKISFTLDEICLPERITLSQGNKILSKIFLNWNKEKFNEYLNKFNLKQNKKIQDLSKGMKAKLNIAIALSHNANILILDEPINGLDPVARDEFCDLLLEFVNENDDNLAFISSHIISDLEKICDEFIFISNGEVLLQEEKNVLENNFLKLEISEDEFNDFDKNLIIKYKKSGSSVDILLKNSEETQKIEGVKKANTEDIIIFLIRGKNV